MKKHAYLVHSLAILPVLLLAQQSMQRAVHETGLTAYRRAVVLLQSHQGSLEQVFYRGMFVRDLLLKPDSRGTTLVETLSSTEFEALKMEFAGFVVGRDEVVFANPDPTYFVNLAREFGDAADQTFFEAYRQTRPAGVWPVWVEQQTDEAGCTRFGSGDLVRVYQLWNDYRQKFPRRYRAEADAFLAAVEDEASSATCACGDASSVLKELEAFDRTFPQTRVDDVVRQRIRELREKRSPIRFGCASGPASRIVR